MVKRRRRMITVPPPEIVAQAKAMAAAGAEPRRHHTIPRFYLRRWASDGDLVRLTRVDDNQRSHLASTRTASTVTDFYRLGEESDPAMSPVMWEAWLSGIEGRAAPVVRSLADRGLEDLDLNEQLALYTFIASFHTRSRGHAERLRQLRVESQRATIVAAPDTYDRYSSQPASICPGRPRTQP